MLKGFLIINGLDIAPINLNQVQKLRDFLRTDLQIVVPGVIRTFQLGVMDDPEPSAAEAAFVAARRIQGGSPEDWHATWRRLDPDEKARWERAAKAAQEFGR